MATTRGSIVIDARVNALRGAHGIARSVMKLTAHLGQAGDGLDLRVLVNAGRPQLFPLSEIPAHADVVDTGIPLGAAYRCAELARLIRSVGAAVLYVPYPTFTPLIRPCPVVVTVHDCTIESSAAFAGGWHRQAWLGLAFRTVLRRAAAVTAPTMASLAEVNRHYPGAHRLTLVPNGVDASQFGAVAEADVAAARARYQLPEQFILTVGAHRPHKNHQTLVRTMAALPESVSLVIVGHPDPTFPARLPRLISALGLDSRVILIPDVADDWLPGVYRAASVFAFPSLAEGYGLPVLEAMAAGLPVVASDIPALAEVAGAAALPVAPLDVEGWTAALAKVLGDHGTSQALAGAGAAVAAAATWHRGAAALLELLSAVARRNLATSPSDPC